MVHRWGERGDKKDLVRVEDANHQSAEAEKDGGDELDAEQVNCQREEGGIVHEIRGQRVADNRGAKMADKTASRVRVSVTAFARE